MIVVYYHYPCPDGGFGALASHLYFSQKNITDVRYFPMDVYRVTEQQVLEDLKAEDDVYFIDHVPNYAFKISDMVNSVVFLDHHQTAVDIIERQKSVGNIPSNTSYVLDMKRSGATIAWDYFTEKLGKPLLENQEDLKKLENLYAYIEDHDLWNNKLENTKEFSLAIVKQNFEFSVNKNSEIFNQLMKIDFEEMVKVGIKEQEIMNNLIKEDLKKAFPITLHSANGEITCLCVETEHIKLRSEIGNELAKLSETQDYPAMAAVTYELKEEGNPSKTEDVMAISLRSLGLDTTEYSSHYGGGGHKCASGFRLPRKDFEKLKI